VLDRGRTGAAQVDAVGIVNVIAKVLPEGERLIPKRPNWNSSEAFADFRCDTLGGSWTRELHPSFVC
jgi:hypothetical protein